MPVFFVPNFLLLGLLVIGISTVSWAQKVTIHGQVLDGMSLEELENVHVYLEEHVGTTTTIEGRFEFEVQHLDTLHFSLVGYDSLSLVITSVEEVQKVILAMHRSTIILESVEIASDYQANTIIKQPERQVYHVPGVKYSTQLAEKNYHMGMAAVASPMTAMYRAFSRKYKEEKKHHLYMKEKQTEDEVYNKAKENLDNAFNHIEEYFDDYYYRDFMQYTGLSVRYVSSCSMYELIKILPQAVKRYQTHLEEEGAEE
ncbi:carboxypeptidase-like regulatory domain-containing protein [Reichenbachiella carrageenanivorans]|uniref:Carboxypeptidase-like regulatory domain-containing protein n=1 Tax=Reichenbachiella carrageenanivorans TaxID=2979869 RepID=A0ABY6D3I0_9BACT|nr:carboxypeptidase-like regulatory domain-containing protein [Reichenbachiella carrageenanivorans]UXX80678.1 carboxypeptidase-like regulatory domain-containing protein [Reichenbachiella carrageenanivorans]